MIPDTAPGRSCIYSKNSRRNETMDVCRAKCVSDMNISLVKESPRMSNTLPVIVASVLNLLLYSREILD